MNILHPVYLVIFAYLLYLFMKSEDIRNSDMNKYIMITGVFLIILAGGRMDVGADYSVYKELYNVGFPIYTTYDQVWDKMTFQPNSMEIEWLYVLINKLSFDLGFSFQVVTFITATISISLIFTTIRRYSALPILSVLFYFMALYFYSDSGQMRQGLGAAICFFSVRYVIKRNLLMFLLCMFIALGFHKSAIIFLPAYWLAIIPMNATRWFFAIVFSVLASPFQIYDLFGGLINSLTPQDVSNAYEGYSNDRYYGQEFQTGVGDMINLFFIVFILLYDKQAQKKIYYYEYFRNFALFGFCLFYIFRGNMIFATRLPAAYLIYSGLLVVPSIVMSVQEGTRKNMKLGFFVYFLLTCWLFSTGNAIRANFVIDRYRHIFWSEK